MGLYRHRTCRAKKNELTKWSDVLRYCIGEVGLKPDEFWSMTFSEVEFACHGYEVRLARTLQLERYMAVILYNANRGKGVIPIRDPAKIMPLITDRTGKQVSKDKLITADEFEEVKQLFSKVVWQKGQN